MAARIRRRRAAAGRQAVRGWRGPLRPPCLLPVQGMRSRPASASRMPLCGTATPPVLRGRAGAEWTPRCQQRRRHTRAGRRCGRARPPRAPPMGAAQATARVQSLAAHATVRPPPAAAHAPWQAPVGTLLLTHLRPAAPARCPRAPSTQAPAAVSRRPRVPAGAARVARSRRRPQRPPGRRGPPAPAQRRPALAPALRRGARPCPVRCRCPRAWRRSGRPCRKGRAAWPRHGARARSTGRHRSRAECRAAPHVRRSRCGSACPLRGRSRQQAVLGARRERPCQMRRCRAAPPGRRLQRRGARHVVGAPRLNRRSWRRYAAAWRWASWRRRPRMRSWPAHSACATTSRGAWLRSPRCATGGPIALFMVKRPLHNSAQRCCH